MLDKGGAAPPYPGGDAVQVHGQMHERRRQPAVHPPRGRGGREGRAEAGQELKVGGSGMGGLRAARWRRLQLQHRRVQ